MKLLSLKELKSFDYVKTKEKVLAYLEDINQIGRASCRERV